MEHLSDPSPTPAAATPRSSAVSPPTVTSERLHTSFPIRGENRKLVVLLVVNVIGVLGTLGTLSILPEKGREIRELRNTSLQISAGQDESALNRLLLEHDTSIRQLEATIPPESQVADVIAAFEQLKNNGTVTNFSFASDTVVRDRLGFSALPVLIETGGTDVEIENKVREITAVPYLVRIVTYEERPKVDSSERSVRLGGVVYVRK